MEYNVNELFFKVCHQSPTNLTVEEKQEWKRSVLEPRLFTACKDKESPTSQARFTLTELDRGPRRRDPPRDIVRLVLLATGRPMGVSGKLFSDMSKPACFVAVDGGAWTSEVWCLLADGSPALFTAPLCRRLS